MNMLGGLEEERKWSINHFNFFSFIIFAIYERFYMTKVLLIERSLLHEKKVKSGSILPRTSRLEELLY